MRLFLVFSLLLLALAVVHAAPAKTTPKPKVTKRASKPKIASPNADLLELDQLMLR